MNFAKFLRTPFLTEHLRATASLCAEKAVFCNISYIYSGFILFSVLNISRARFLSGFTSSVDLPDVFK